MEIEGGPLRSPAPAEQRDAFAAYLRHTDEKHVAVSAIARRLHAERPELAVRLADPADDVSILFVGAGRGDLEIPLIRSIVEARGGDGRLLRVHCADADPAMRDAFMAAAAAAGAAPPSGGDFDLAISAHLLHYVDDWDAAVTALRSAVRARDGAALVVLLSRDSDDVRLRSALMESRGGFAIRGAGEEVDAWLEAQGIGHFAETVAATVDARPFFREARFAPSEAGRQMLTFILRAAWDDIPAAERTAIGGLTARLAVANGAAVLRARSVHLWIDPAA